jgi:Pyruvate/2-oxoacid:ferredoxin oxidoreductase delta subunit
MIVSQEHRDDLIKIAKKLERKAQSFAKDENGEPTENYLQYISMMFPPEVAKIVIHLPVFPSTISLLKLKKQLGMEKEVIISTLEEPASRGFVISLGKSYAQLNPLLTYDMPFILKRNYDQEDVKKFAELSRKFYVDDKYYKTWQTSRKGVPRMRVLTVSEEVEDEKEIIPIEEVYKIIDKWDDFALIPCPCRQRREVEGIRECTEKYPIHNCVLFGPMAKAVLDMDDPIVKSSNREEIKKVTKEAAEIGLVHMTDNRAENCTILCACCECCCGMLRGLTRFDNPRAIAKANFISTIDSEICTGCETCLSRCKFEAINVDTVAQVNNEKCVGCGLCAVTCPSEAISMTRFEREMIPS